MYDTLIGTFKAKADYEQAAQKAMARRLFLNYFNENDERLQMIKQEYQRYFGLVTFEKNNQEMVTITKQRCHHSMVWERKECL